MVGARGAHSREWRRGWRLVLGAAIGMGSGISVFAPVFGLFVRPLQEAFGWGRGQIALSSLAIFGTTLFLPAAGLLADKVGPAVTTAVGSALFAACYLGLANLAPDPTSYIAILVLIGVAAGPLTAPVVLTRSVVTAFERARGKALAVSLSGNALITIALLPVVQSVITTSGWRLAFVAMAPFCLVCGLAAGCLTRRTLIASRQPPAPGPTGDGLTMAQAVRSPAFWFLGAAMLCANLPAGAMATQLQPLLADRGFAPGDAAALGSGFAAAIVIGRLGIGVLLDRFHPPVVAAGAIGVAAICLLLLVLNRVQTPLAVAAVLVLGAVQGGEVDMMAYFTSRCFGVAAFGAIFGAQCLFYGVAMAVGGVVGGASFDLTGDYQALLAASAATASAGAFLLVLGDGVRPWRPSPDLSARGEPAELRGRG